jgi:hypothetical protein
MTETKTAEEHKKERRIENEIEVAAPAEEVWKALTDAGELARWFPLEAHVTLGLGGKIMAATLAGNLSKLIYMAHFSPRYRRDK